MEDLQPKYLGHFDFSLAQTLPLEERLYHCVAQIKRRHQELDILAYLDFPLIPSVGASDQEISQLEAELKLSLPEDYRILIRNWRYIRMDLNGVGIWGLDYDRPFIIDELAVPGTYLVFGDYWRFADGDQLMLKLDHPDQPVVVYLHEYGPLVEYYAPNISFALWRMIYEKYP